MDRKDSAEKQIFAKNLADYISKSEKKRGVIAKDLGVSASALNKWCRGAAMPSMDRIQEIATYFGCRKSDLLEQRVNPMFGSDIFEMISLYSELSDETKNAVLYLLRTLSSKEK